MLAPRLIFPPEAAHLPYGRQRRLMPLPRLADLPDEARHALWDVDVLASQAANLAAHLPSVGLETALPPAKAPLRDLHHELSPLFPLVTAPIALTAARHEWATLARVFAQLHDARAARAPGALLATIHEVMARLTGDPALRDRDRCASPDRFGRYVTYPAPALIGAQLQRIVERVCEPDPRPRSFDLALLLVAITNCHPFIDGNGRLARILGNGLLNDSATVPRLYLPLREIARLARGGYVLRVRLVETQGDWVPLARLLRAAMRLWHDHLLHRLELERSHAPG